jgi:uroporphyrinogen decarboxylase
MNKREVVLSLLDRTPPYTPAAFFLHFAKEYHEGQAAVEKHLEYYRYTGMDLVKIQYERTFPPVSDIRKPEDWARMPRYGQDFFDGQLAVVRGLVNAARSEAVIVQTLYSPFMCAGHSTSDSLLTEHLWQEPDQVKKGLEIITDSLLVFVRACIKLGIDGFYASTQGGEASRFTDTDIFETYIKPYDLALMNEANQACPFNILHVCDYQRDYDDFSPFLDYPGQIVNCPLKLGGKPITPKQAAEMFKRPYMGGLERKGVIATGTPDEIGRAVDDVLREAPGRFMLGADCTVPNLTPWANLKTAIDAAHTHSPAKQ